jgi:glycosyltransferase involved in cell wall biosynthesis
VKIVYADLDREWRGGQNQALLTCMGLIARRNEVELIAVEGGALAKRAKEADVPLRIAQRSGRRWNATREIKEATEAGGVDIVHANEPHALTAAWMARIHRRTALVISRRVAYPIARNWASRSRYRSADRIFAISKFVAGSVVDSGIEPKKIAVVYEGVAIPPPITSETRAAARRAFNFDDDEFVLGCVGYLLPEKNQEQLIRALPELLAIQPKLKLFLAGDGPERRHLQTLAAGLRIRKHILFAGFVERIADVFLALDAFVFPSLAEPLGTSLLAAMSYGLPIAAVASGGVPEYVTHQVNGLLAPQPTAEALVAAIHPLLQDAFLRQDLGTRARHDIAERFSESVMVENTIRAYEEVLQERSAKPQK